MYQTICLLALFSAMVNNYAYMGIFFRFSGSVIHVSDKTYHFLYLIKCILIQIYIVYSILFVSLSYSKNCFSVSGIDSRYNDGMLELINYLLFGFFEVRMSELEGYEPFFGHFVFNRLFAATEFNWLFCQNSQWSDDD